MIISLLASAAALALSPEEGHDHAPKLGTLTFESSCNPQAHEHFEHGLGWLHSFEYAEAERSFTQAADADPGCGIAHWGAAMSYYHPLWAPPTAEELEKGRAAIEKARAAGAKSKREQAYIDAIAAFYRDSERLDHRARTLAYSSAMERLHQYYPDDREAAVFYALSLIAVGTMDTDPDFNNEKQAAALLNGVLAVNADHPGVAHYLIHSFDYPPLAHLAVPAARRYASIAPDSAHAQHMPSHIFTRLGLWDDAIKSNLKSEAAAIAYAKAKGLQGSWDERLHAMDYLAYAYLQTGQDREARRVLAELNSIQRVDPANFKVAFSATAIPARFLLERRQWREAASLQLPDNVTGLVPLADHPWAQAHIHFARAIGAARSGNPARAREEVARLGAIEQTMSLPLGTYDWKTQVSIQRQIAEGWLAHAEGRNDDAVSEMRAAADLDDATEKHPVTPGAVLPAREQLGELLLEIGKPDQALNEFEASLKRAPRRLSGVYGAASAAKLAGDAPRSSRYFAELVEVTNSSEGERPEIREARNAVKGFAGR